MNIEIGSQTLTQKFLFADIENEGILGMDFLTAHQCDLMLTHSYLKIKREKIRCFANSRNAQPTCCPVAISEGSTIPPETEMLVEGFTTNVIDRPSTGLIEVDTKFLHKTGLLVAKALVCPSDGTVPICLANPYKQSFTLTKHTIVRTYEPLKAEELVTVNATQSNDSD